MNRYRLVSVRLGVLCWQVEEWVLTGWLPVAAFLDREDAYGFCALKYPTLGPADLMEVGAL